MTLYVSNPTHQSWTVPYRVHPDFQILRQFTLGRGQQTEIGHGWTAEQQAEVIRQLEAHGARDAAEAHGKMGSFTSLLYRDRGVIETAEIEMAHDADTLTREERSRTQAVRGALAFDNAARKPAAARPPARVTETTVEEQVPRGTRRKGGEVAFNLSVDPDGRSDVKLPV